MPDKAYTLLSPKRLRTASWLALLAMLCLQLTLVSHQFEHSAAEASLSCEICIQADRLDDAAAEPFTLSIAPLGRDIELIQHGLATIGRGFLLAFNSRAPPLL